MTDTNGNGNGTNGNGLKVNKVAVVSSNTLIPLGAVVLVFMAAWNVQSFMEKKFKDMQEQLNDIKHAATASNYSMNSQLGALKTMMVNRWTSQDMKIWEQELKIRNPTIDVPNSTDITRTRTTPDSVGR